MLSRLNTLLITVFLLLGLAFQSVGAGACPGAGSVDGPAHAAHMDMSVPGMEMSGMEMPDTDMPGANLPGSGDCCDDSEHCPMQACFTGAALPCTVDVLQLPPSAALLPPAPVRNTSPACSRFERPPIFA
ncbi:hypothetical protein FV139_10840 [Parahaliea maris]|uniref:CopL family metal-binding regulatory protein n=1 Tax=Parahaliea maris TaxID=2716870 RepID=A0A5C9A263_9GAMM|nr:hypothetical protein [Parahaliea maris]TXS94094.1 hypothetical protein FV139_10840 [Parahaliea maris]